MSEVVNKYYKMFDPYNEIRIRERITKKNLNNFEEFLLENININDENIECDYGNLIFYIKKFVTRQTRQRSRFRFDMSSIYSDKSDTNLQPFLTQESGSSQNVILAKLIIGVIDKIEIEEFLGGRKSRRSRRRSKKSRKSRRR